MDGTFCIQKISNTRQSKMESSPKQGTHLWCQIVMDLIYQSLPFFIIWYELRNVELQWLVVTLIGTIVFVFLFYEVISTFFISFLRVKKIASFLA
mgnify:CR=1 FL=1